MTPLDPDLVNGALARLNRGAEAWRRRPVVNRIDSLARGTRRFAGRALDGADRGALLSRIEESTGYSRPVLVEGIRRLAGAVTPEALRRWWGKRSAGPGSGVPGIVAVVSAGNIPGVALFPAVAALLAGSGVLIKTAGAEPWLMPAWAEALGDRDEAAAEALLVMNWAGGREPLEDRLLGAADLILAFGHDETMSALSRRFPGLALAFGTGLSFGLVNADRVDDRDGLIELARDVALWDQQGCLSPHGVWVVGGRADAERVAAHLAAALAVIEREWPRGRISPEEAGHLRSWRAELEARRLAGEPIACFAPGESLAWTVWTADDPALKTSPLNRSLWVSSIRGRSDLAERLARWRGRLQGAALLAGPAGQEEWSRGLLEIGVPFVAPAGRLQNPPVNWPNKGIDLLSRLAGEESI